VEKKFGEEDWAIMYFAWMNSLPLSDCLWRWESQKRRAAEGGHTGSCVKQPAACPLCIVKECMEGGARMSVAWDDEARKERP